MKKLCEIQETCKEFTNSHKQRTHGIRVKEPCQKWIDMDCPMGIAIYEWYEEQSSACDIDKVKRLKEGLISKGRKK